MDPDRMSLADEVKAAMAPVAGGGPGIPGAIRAERVRASRSRFLPYVVVGAALSCGYLAVVVATKDNLGSVYGSAVTAGILAGMTVGWVLLGLYRRHVDGRADGRRWVDLMIVLLTLPAYVVAGWVSAWVGWTVAVLQARPTPEPDPPNAWGLLIWLGVLIYPLSYAFARRDLNRPNDFTGALLAAKNEIHETPHTQLVLWDFLIALTWCIGSLFIAYFVLINVQVVIPVGAALGSVGPWLATAIFFVVWIGLTVEGTRRTRRWLLRRWPPRLTGR